MWAWTKPLHRKGTTGFVFRNPQAFEEENGLPLPLGCLRQHVANSGCMEAASLCTPTRTAVRNQKVIEVTNGGRLIRSKPSKTEKRTTAMRPQAGRSGSNRRSPKAD